MATVLNDVEARVLGSLVEKQLTTPEYYPLTLNSLTLACNQKNNRTPVTSYDETTVAQALESLREKNLAYVFYGSTSRVPKYKHVLPEVMHLNAPELASNTTLRRSVQLRTFHASSRSATSCGGVYALR